MPPLPLRFVTSASTYETLPATPAELAFIGRSNVGKSSLINALANQKQLAKVSKTPGRTQLLNLFELRDGRTLVDLPGYGFANAPKAARANWGRMTERYLLEREGLERILVLVDGEIGPTKLDVNMLEWLRDCDLPFAVIATKHDKVKSSVRQKRKRELAAGCGLEERDITWVSASKGVNLDQLRDKIHRWLSPEPEPDEDW
jgi:GTP-binding protein